jgi:dihydrofolate reductase
MIVSAIAAMGKNRVIGKNNDLLWRLPLEFQYFKKTTMGHHLIMGRKTFESIPNVLPGRTTIVVTRQKDFEAKGAHVSHSLEEAIQWARVRGETECFIAGGAQIYQQALALIDKLYITEVDYAQEGDAYFPTFDDQPWQLIQETICEQSDKNPYAWTAKIFERTNG